MHPVKEKDRFDVIFYEFIDRQVKYLPGRKMNFTEAMEAAKKGFYVKRPCWDENMRAWWTGKFIAHSHKYDAYQEFDPDVDGYTYVVEKDDAEASDWQRAGFREPIEA